LQHGLKLHQFNLIFYLNSIHWIGCLGFGFTADLELLFYLIAFFILKYKISFILIKFSIEI